jgi:hypothetical protein
MLDLDQGAADRGRHFKRVFRGGPFMSHPPIMVSVSNPDAFSGMGSIIVLEMEDENAAIKVARRIARETGRCVTVRDADMTLIETLPAASTH